MSFNRLNTDTCAYAQELSESVGPGEYKLAEPNRGANCVQCFPRDPRIRMQRSGVGIDSTRPMIDTNSDILNIKNFSKFSPHIHDFFLDEIVLRRYFHDLLLHQI